MAQRVGIKVAVRTRPTAAFDQDEIFVDANNATIDVHHKTNFDAVSNKQEHWNFKYHQIMHNSTQEQTYDSLCRDIVDQALVNGRNGAILAYGQTGSGKTFTMTGDPHSYRNRGIVPRAVAHVFQHIASKPESEFSVSISYMEVYGEKIRDLLVVAGATNGVAPGTAAALGITVNRSGQLMGGTGGHENAVLNPGEFNIVEDPVHGTVVRGLTLVPAASEEEVLNAAFAAELARTTADHALNKNSNRSHCIFTIYIQQRSRLGGGREKIISSKVHLVDLAGSERIKKTMGTGPLGDGAEAELQRESMAINKSLTYLEQCVVALSSRSRTHVPYKNSMLTKVLRDALGGNCATLLIACVWGEARHLEETISTLRFAQRMMAVQNEVTEQHYIDADAMLKKLTREVAQLKQELQMHDALADRSGIQYSDYTPEQQASLSIKIKNFIEATSDEGEAAALQLESVQQMREVLRQVKVMVKHAAVEAEERIRSQYTLVRKDGSGPGQTGSSLLNSSISTCGIAASNMLPLGSGGTSGISIPHLGGVGAIDESVSGIGLGLAASSARPSDVQLPASIARRAQDGSLASPSSPLLMGSTGGMSMGGTFTNFNGTSKGAAPGSPSGAGGRGRSTSPTHHHHAGSSTMGRTNIALDLNGAWRQFKTTPGLGLETATEITSLRDKLEAKKSEAQTAAKTANEAKARIESLTKQLSDLRTGMQTRPGTAGTQMTSVSGGNGASIAAKPGSAGSKKAGATVAASKAGSVVAGAPDAGSATPQPSPEEEEARISAEITESKRIYRASYERVASAREAGQRLAEEINGLMQAQLRDFETWYASCTGRLPPVPVSPARDRSGSPFRSGARQQGFGATATYDWTTSSAGGPGNGGAGGAGDDALDDAEAFENMEMERVTAAEPDSVAYFSATRKIRQGAKPFGRRAVH